MIRWTPLLAGLLCFAPFAQSESVYKCASPAGVTYQGSPCDGAAATSSEPSRNVPASAAAITPQLAETPLCSPRPVQLPQARWRPRSLCIGITDDEVLNLAGWGRPSNIARVRNVRGWQEQWTYVSRAATSRRLEFVNGKLASVEILTADERESMRVPVASLTSTQ